MFTTVTEFILVMMLAAAAVGGLAVGRRLLNGVALRLKLDGTKTKIELQNLEHNLVIGEHQNSLQLMALTKTTESSKREIESESKAEEARFKKGDILQPSDFKNYKAYQAHMRDQRDATDAEISEINMA